MAFVMLRGPLGLHSSFEEQSTSPLSTNSAVAAVGAATPSAISTNSASMGLFGTVKGKLLGRGSGLPRNKSPKKDRASSSTSSPHIWHPPGQQLQEAGASESQQRGLQSHNSFGISAPPTRRPGSQFPGRGHEGGPVDAPPAYSPPSAPVATTSAAIATAAATDDRFTFLSTFDTIFLIDDSGSMAGRSWRETATALRTIAPICTARDADGIDIHFLNHAANEPQRYCNVTSTETIEQIFNTVSPRGGTPTGVRLHQILKPYLQRYQARPTTTKPLNIVVITDGVPSDDVESVIIAVAKQLDKAEAPAWQVGVQFFQVGNERGAAEALRELDDGLADVAGIRDMVDTVPFGNNPLGTDLSADKILKVVLGAVNRRLDRKKT